MTPSQLTVKWVQRNDLAYREVAELAGVPYESVEAMDMRQLNADESKLVNDLLNSIREDLDRLSHGDPDLLWAIRRKVYKELRYDERGKPAHRKKLKELKRKEQKNLCPLFGNELPEAYVMLDRIKPMLGYTAENTRLIHRKCDKEVQESRGYG